MTNEGECEAQVMGLGSVGPFKCGLPVGHEGEHERHVPGYELYPGTPKEAEIVISWKVDHESTKR